MGHGGIPENKIPQPATKPGCGDARDGGFSIPRPGANSSRRMRIASLPMAYYGGGVKTLTVKLSDPLFAEIACAAEARKVSKSEIVRERLARAGGPAGSLWSRMEDLVIERDSLPKDLSSNEAHLKKYGKNRADR
jgi:hypothetical protein